ncbi:MAG: hypothetical protein P9M12_06190 [Candidatus Aceula lacicola]|nr:hypothetical protein [Candidatus Aceula lacicola]
MSIINEALKKTQSILSSQKNQDDPTQKDPWIKAAMLIIIGGFLGCAIVFGTIILSNNNTLPSKPLENAKTINANSSSSTPKDATVKKQPAASSGIELNGIMQTGDQYMALINNKIVRQGDAIDDKKVLDITENSVKIFDNGEVFVLKLNP